MGTEPVVEKPVLAGWIELGPKVQVGEKPVLAGEMLPLGPKGMLGENPPVTVAGRLMPGENRRRAWAGTIRVARQRSTAIFFISRL